MKDEWKKGICHATRYTLYSLATDYNEVTGLTKSQLMRLALAGKSLELGRGAMKVPRAKPESPTENTTEDDRFVQGRLFSDIDD